MKKKLVYSATLIVHALIGGGWITLVQCYFPGYCGGFLALASMWLHQKLFNNACLLTHVERWIHIKVLGESRIPDLKYKKTRFYKIIKKIKP